MPLAGAIGEAMRRQLTFGEWLLFGPKEEKKHVLSRAATLLGVTEDALEWQWDGGGWRVRVRREKSDANPES